MKGAYDVRKDDRSEEPRCDRAERHTDNMGVPIEKGSSDIQRTLGSEQSDSQGAS